MEKNQISESMHDFFEDGPTAKVSEKPKIRVNMETDRTNAETTSTEICDDVNDNKSRSIEEFERLEHTLTVESDHDEFSDEDVEITNSPDKDAMVIVQIDDGGPRPPRQSNSEVVIPYSPEFSPSESSSSGSSVYTSDDTDSDAEEGYQTPVYVIKAVHVVGSQIYEVSDNQEAASPADRSVFAVRSESVAGYGDGLPRVDDDADDESNESERDSYSSDDGSEYEEREMLFTHYKRANGQSIVEKVYLDIAKFVEEHAGRLKPRSRSVSSRGFRQSSSVTGLPNPGKRSVTHRANSAHCTLSTGRITEHSEATRKDEDTQTSNSDTFRSVEYYQPSRDSAVSVSGSDVSCDTTDDENDGRDSEASRATDDVDDGRGSEASRATDDGDDGRGSEASRATDDGDDGRGSDMSVHALIANKGDIAKPDNDQHVDIKTKHYPILPDIGKGAPAANITSQTSADRACGFQTTQLAGGVIPKTLSKSANTDPKHSANRKPGVPRQLKSVACYQDGRVSVSILGDQRVFGESEPPHLNITFVHRQEPPVKKSATARDEPEARINELRTSFAKVKDANDVTAQQNRQRGGQATSAYRKPLPPIGKSSKSDQQGKQNAKKLTKMAKKPSTLSKHSRNTKKILPPLKGVPKLNLKGRKFDGKKPKTRPNHFNKDFGMPATRRNKEINWNIVQTRAQWPSLNTHLDPDASERHRKMITSIPV